MCRGSRRAAALGKLVSLEMALCMLSCWSLTSFAGARIQTQQKHSASGRRNRCVIACSCQPLIAVYAFLSKYCDVPADFIQHWTRNTGRQPQHARHCSTQKHCCGVGPIHKGTAFLLSWQRSFLASCHVAPTLTTDSVLNRVLTVQRCRITRLPSVCRTVSTGCQKAPRRLQCWAHWLNSMHANWSMACGQASPLRTHPAR